MSMPPDARALVNKFVPNNTRLAKVVLNTLNDVFKARFLPQELVKVVVRRAMELEREQDMDVESSVFTEKLKSYVTQVKPRFMKMVIQGNRSTRSW